MKKQVLGLLSLLFASTSVYADTKKVIEKELHVPQSTDIEKKRVERERKRLDKNLKKRAKERKKEAEKEKKSVLKQTNNQKKNSEKSQRNAENKAKRRERVQHKELKEKQLVRQTVHEQRKREKLSQKRERALKKSKERKERCAALDREIDAHYSTYKNQLAEKCARRKELRVLADTWRDRRHAYVEDEYAGGAYADLYKQPTWPTYATYIRHKWLFNLGFNYRYATDAYSCDGHNHDITRLVFGENDVRVRDVLLVSDLVSRTPSVTQKDQDIGGQNDNQPANQYLRYLADEKIKFLGEQKELRWNLDLARYIWKRAIAVGIEVPIVYMKNRLRANMVTEGYTEANGFNADNLPDQFVGRAGLAQVSNNIIIDEEEIRFSDYVPNMFLRRYGNCTDKFIQDIFREKCMPKLGGSSSGLGDITLFAHAYVDSARFDKMMFGIRTVIPTAQRANVNHLWAPELGNGGFFECAGFMNLVLSHKWWLNPHFFMQVSGTFLKAHVKKRVPKRVTFATQDQPFDDFTGFQGVTFSDRVVVAADTTISELDTPFRHLGDFVARFEARKGPEFTVRVGNIVEKFIWRRAFLDTWYQFKAKSSDFVGGLDCNRWCLDIYKKNTETIEHRAGFDFSYQFDAGSRIHTGLAWTFAGRNVPANFDWNVSVNYSF